MKHAIVVLHLLVFINFTNISVPETLCKHSETRSTGNCTLYIGNM